MKFVSWNVNGLRACAGKGFADAFNSLDADFFCLQETKMQPGQLDMEFEGYKSYWNSAEKKGYSGTAVYAVLGTCMACSHITRQRRKRTLHQHPQHGADSRYLVSRRDDMEPPYGIISLRGSE